MKKETTNSVNYIVQKAGKNSGFSAPSNYFDHLENMIEVKIAEEKLVNKSPFSIADNYFENLEDQILSKVLSEEKNTKVISFKDRLLKVIPFAAAASILLFIGLNSYVFSSSTSSTLEGLSDNDIEYWLENNTINTFDIATVFEEDIIEENVLSFANLEDESIEDYMNSVEENYLLNDLE